MSTSTTSARPASAIRCAVVAPTLPAPMTVTLLRAIAWPLLLLSVALRRPGQGAASAASALAGAGDPGMSRAGGMCRPCGPHGLADAFRVGLEVVVEHRRDGRGGRVVGGAVGPGLARAQDLARDARDLCRDGEPEHRVRDGRDVAEVAVERCPDHVPGVRDVHAV